ncbi:carboxylesterase family protein, partial [Streptomyces sp. NPDC059627]
VCLDLCGLYGKIRAALATGALRVFARGGAAGDVAYRAAHPDASPSELYERVQTDWLFAIPSLRLAEAQTAGGGRAHLYELTWGAPGNGGLLGACHGLDIPLLFGTFEADLANLLWADTDVTPEAKALSARFRTAWTSFAATGDPGWPAYDTDTRSTQVLDTAPTVTPYPEEKSRQLWEGYDFTPSPLLG